MDFKTAQESESQTDKEVKPEVIMSGPLEGQLEKIGDLVENRRYQLSAKGLATRKHLSEQPLVKVLIPRDANEPKTAVHDFNRNGFSFCLPKGVYVNVPQDVADQIVESCGQDARVLADHPLNLRNNIAAAREFSR